MKNLTTQDVENCINAITHRISRLGDTIRHDGQDMSETAIKEYGKKINSYTDTLNRLADIRKEMQ